MKGKQNRTLQSDELAAIGEWMGVVGTVVAAIGSTPSIKLSSVTMQNLNIIGNVLQACGSAIAAENGDVLLNTVGNQLQALGNIAVVSSILSPNERLATQGELLQIVGLGATFQIDRNMSVNEVLNTLGTIIQIIGNTIQVLADTNTTQGMKLNATGNWIQVIGTVISAIAT